MVVKCKKRVIYLRGQGCSTVKRNGIRMWLYELFEFILTSILNNVQMSVFNHLSFERMFTFEIIGSCVLG